MLEMTAEAKKELDEYFKDNEKGTIRIFLAPGGCSGPRLALALDEPTGDDSTHDIDGYKFCINKELLDQIKGARIDLTPMGFNIDPTVPLPAGAGGGCGGCCGGCGSN